MEPNPEGQEPQKNPEEIIAGLKATIEELKPKADVSSQNYERLKKLETEKKELEAKLGERGDSSQFDPNKLKSEIEDRVALRLAGHTPEEMEEIERYARGAGISLTEAAKSPFIMKAVDGLRAERKSVDSTPAPSSKIRTFQGKPVDEIIRSGTDAEKQAAFEARMKGVVKSSE